jgi:CheY-like chemotaxis protein
LLGFFAPVPLACRSLTDVQAMANTECNDQDDCAFDVHEAPTLNGICDRPSVVDPLVLVVDDEEDSCAIYCASLEHMGYRTMSRSDGKQAVEAAHRYRPSVVLMDLTMPLVDGLEATRQIKADTATQGTVVIAMTGLGASRYGEADEAGCDAFLCKPFNAFLLAEILGALAHRREDGIVKRCGCGRSYRRDEWKALPLRGTMEGTELRNCPCGSTIGVSEAR